MSGPQALISPSAPVILARHQFFTFPFQASFNYCTCYLSTDSTPPCYQHGLVHSGSILQRLPVAPVAETSMAMFRRGFITVNPMRICTRQVGQSRCGLYSRPRCLQTPPMPCISRHTVRHFSQGEPDSQELSASSGFPPIDDTIYALSTANGRAGIAVIRISGSSCLDVGTLWNRYRWDPSLINADISLLVSVKGCPKTALRRRAITF